MSTIATFVVFVGLVVWKLDWLMRHAVAATLIMATVAAAFFVATVESGTHLQRDFTVGTEVEHQDAHTSFATIDFLCGGDGYLGYYSYGPVDPSCPFTLTVEALPAHNDDPTVTIVMRVENRSPWTALLRGTPPDMSGYQSSTCPGHGRSTVLRPASTLECTVVFDSWTFARTAPLPGEGEYAPPTVYADIATRRMVSYWYRNEIAESSVGLAAEIPPVPRAR